MGWTLTPSEAGLLVRCEPLAAIGGLAHAWSTRTAEDGAFDLGPAHADPVQAARRARFLAAAGFDPAEPPLVLRQVHGAAVARPPAGAQPPEADAAVRIAGDPPGVPSVRTADCVGLLLGVRGGRAAAAVHAGWRGTAAGVVEAALAALTRAAGCAPDQVVAGLGPAIGGCCYRVGPEVVAAVGSEGGVEKRGDGLYLDLRTAVRERLLAAGVPARAVTSAPWCTRCRGDLFYSYRGEGERAGRLMASIGPLTAPSP